GRRRIGRQRDIGHGCYLPIKGRKESSHLCREWQTIPSTQYRVLRCRSLLAIANKTTSFDRRYGISAPRLRVRTRNVARKALRARVSCDSTAFSVVRHSVARSRTLLPVTYFASRASR